MHSIRRSESNSQYICNTCGGGRLAFLLILLATNVIPALSSSLSLSRLKSTNIKPSVVIKSNCDALSDIWGLRDNNRIFVKNTNGNVNIVSRSSPSPFLPLFSSLSYINRRRARSSSSNAIIESLRGGGSDGSLVDDDEEEYDDDYDDESEDDDDYDDESEDDINDETSEDGEGESDNADTDDDSDESDDTDEIEEESSEGEHESEYGGYDDESEYDEDEGASPISSRSNSGTEQVYDEPLVLSSTQDMGVTLGVLLVCNKLDLTNTRLIKVFRFAYIAYVILAQLFLVYVRQQAHKINDRTQLTINNPLSNMLKNQLGSAGQGDMVKNMANSFLSSESTIMEYDLSQAKNMNGSLLFPMVMLYFLHFKMGQVQPLFYQTVMGIKTVMTSPLFQVYVLGRNLERPFRSPQADKFQQNQDESEEVPGLDQSGEEVEEDAEESDSSNSEDDSDYSDSDEDTESDDDSDEKE